MIDSAGLDEPADGVGQAFLVGIVVAALEVAAQVVAHDRGHLVAAEGVEPGEVVDRPAVRGVRRDELVGSGQPGDLAADAGEVRAVREDQEPAELDARVAHAPDLPVDECGRLGAVADQVAEAVVAVHQSRRDGGRAPRRRGARCSRSASGTRCGGTAAIVRAQRPSSSSGRQRRGVDRHLVERYVVQRRQHLRGAQHPGGRERRRHLGVVEHRLEGLALDQLHREPGRLGVVGRDDRGDGYAGRRERRDHPRLAQHVVPADRLLALGHRLDHQRPLAGLEAVGQPGVPAGQPGERARPPGRAARVAARWRPVRRGRSRSRS